ncbi:hypothetical protein QR680_007629 [Steinernema hermaphroditum]|uniref:Uncharacterized protein n=1 Tax=Steinernema hermaphroditum TaxID=289476 RepID=A0AA39IF63_9BILA|nr:hypothetical protein QR680_007629 [Steinernema hermaphroditum]
MSTMRIPKAVVFCTVLLNTAAAAIDTVSVPGTSAQLSRIASSPKPNWAERRNPRSPARSQKYKIGEEPLNDTSAAYKNSTSAVSKSSADLKSTTTKRPATTPKSNAKPKEESVSITPPATASRTVSSSISSTVTLNFTSASANASEAIANVTTTASTNNIKTTTTSTPKTNPILRTTPPKSTTTASNVISSSKEAIQMSSISSESSTTVLPKASTSTVASTNQITTSTRTPRTHPILEPDDSNDTQHHQASTQYETPEPDGHNLMIAVGVPIFVVFSLIVACSLSAFFLWRRLKKQKEAEVPVVTGPPQSPSEIQHRLTSQLAYSPSRAGDDGITIKMFATGPNAPDHLPAHLFDDVPDDEEEIPDDLVVQFDEKNNLVFDVGSEVEECYDGDRLLPKKPPPKK